MNKPSSIFCNSFFGQKGVSFYILAFMDHLLSRYLEKKKTAATPIPDHVLNGLLPYLVYWHDKGHADFVVRHMTAMVLHNARLHAFSADSFSFARTCFDTILRRNHEASLRLLEQEITTCINQSGRRAESYNYPACFVELQLHLICQKGIRRVALFGAGQHTLWLKNNVRLPWGLTIAAVLDDNPTPLSSFAPVPVLRPEEVDPLDFDAVILSSDQWQAKFRQRLIAAWGETKKPIVDLYENLPPGPYPKNSFCGGTPASVLHAFQKEIWAMTLTLLRIERNIKTVAIFGAGKHTRRLNLDAMELHCQVRIVAILDDAPPSADLFHGRRVLKPKEANPAEFDAVVLSSDTCPAAMRRRCREIFPATMPIIDPYA